MSGLRSRARLRPFSKAPGVAALIPGSPISVRIFPKRLIGTNLLTEEEIFDIEVEAPDRFLVIQEIDRKRLVIPNHLTITHEKRGVRIGGKTIKAAEPFNFDLQEKLFFGCHKSPDVDLMRRRLAPEEYLPYMHALGALIPPLPGECPIAQEMLPELFFSNTEGLFTPRSGDYLHTGHPNPAQGSPLLLLRAVADLLRKQVKTAPPHHCGTFNEGDKIHTWSRSLRCYTHHQG